MRYYKNLYLSESVKKKKRKIISKLDRNKLQMNLYLLTIAQNESDQLDIINSIYLKQPDFPSDGLFVIGIAKSQDEAIELVEEISKEVYNNTGDLNIRSYILMKEQES